MLHGKTLYPCIIVETFLNAVLFNILFREITAFGMQGSLEIKVETHFQILFTNQAVR